VNAEKYHVWRSAFTPRRLKAELALPEKSTLSDRASECWERGRPRPHRLLYDA